MRVRALLSFGFLIALVAFPAHAARAAVLPTSSETLTGWFHVIWGDGQQGSGISLEVYTLTDDSGSTRMLLMDAALARPLGGVAELNGKRVTVVTEPAKLARAAGFPTWRVISISVEPPTVQIDRASADALTGPQPWVSVMCKFADVADEPRSLSYFTGMYADTHPGLGYYWREVSYNAINVVGSTAVGWYILPQPKAYYVYDRNGDGQVEPDWGRIAVDCTGVADAAVFFPNFVGINLMLNSDLGCCAWGGGSTLTLDGQMKYYRMTWEPPWGYGNQSVMAHEMGHGFGLPHSSGQYGLTYDNRWDVMSDTWSNCQLHPTYGCLAQHTIAYYKDRLGWILPGRKQTVYPGQTATLTLEQLGLPQTADPLLAVVPIRGDLNRFYTVETRRQVGEDVYLPGSCVVIHEVSMGRGNVAHVIDWDYVGDTGDAGGQWLAGETFFDNANGITIAVNAATSTGYTVTIVNQQPDMGYGMVMAQWDTARLQAMHFDWMMVFDRPETQQPVKVLLRVPARSSDLSDLSSFAARLQWLALTCGQNIDAYQIGNEPNLNTEWGAPPQASAYVVLLKAAYLAIKSADPTAVIVSAGLATTGRVVGSWSGHQGHNGQTQDEREFLREFVGLGGGDWADAIGYNALGFRATSAAAPDVNGGTLDTDCSHGLCFRSIERIREILMQNLAGGWPVWATETGWIVEPPAGCLSDPDWTDRAWQAVSEQAQADNLAGAFRRGRVSWSWLGAMFGFNLNFNVAPCYDSCEQMRYYAVQGRSAEGRLAKMPKGLGDAYLPLLLR